MTIKKNYNKLFLILFFLILGISFQEIFSVKINTLYLACLLTIIFLPTTYTYFSYKSKYQISNKNIINIILAFYGGASLYAHQINNHNKLFEKILNKKIDVLCVIKNINQKQNSRIKEEVLVEVKKTLKPTKEKVNFKLSLYINKNTKLEQGQTVIFRNLNIKKNIKNDSYQKYLIKEKVLTSIFSNNINYEIIKEPKNTLLNKIYRIRRKLYLRLKEKIPSKTFDYFSSIFLGNKTNITNADNKNLFNIWGVSHYLARSGLHIVIFILIWQLLLSLIPISINYKNIFLLIIVTLYTLLTWPALSLYRAVYVFILIQLSNILSHPNKYLHLLLLTAIVNLLLNPIQFFFIDFQLTYGLTFALLLVNETTNNQINAFKK